MSNRPEDVGLSSDRLARIDSHLKRRYLDTGKIAGAHTLVYRRDALAYSSPIGSMDLERTKPMAEDTIFRIYSMTKPITSVALMQLYEHGHFQLDDPVYKLIPSWRDLRVYSSGTYPDFLTDPCDRPMTIRHLLTHQSGLTYDFMRRTNVDHAYRKLGLGSEGKQFETSLEEFVEMLAGVPLEFSPGDHFNYSVSTDVCGRLVEILSGEPFDEYLRRHIFEPLGMEDTAFFVPDEKIHRFAANYHRVRRKLTLLDDPEKSEYRKPPRFLSGGGGLVSTAADYLRFARMLLGGGALDGTRILSPKTVAFMTQNHLSGGRDMDQASAGGLTEIGSPGTGFGLGLSVTLDPIKAGVVSSPGEYAWGGAASTTFWVDPVEELIVIFMTQFFPSQIFEFRDQLKTIVYGAIDDPAHVRGRGDRSTRPVLEDV